MHKLSLRSLVFALALMAVLIAGARVQAQDDEPTPEGPTAVTLVSYTATPLNNAVKLVWITGTELNTAGFRIKRGAPDGPFEYLDFLGDDASGIIYGLGGVSEGAIYERTDDTVQNGETYTYILLEVENNGSEVEPENARRTVTVGLPPTNTPVAVVVPGATATGTRPASGSTATSVPTASRPATAATSQAQATATPLRFATVTPSARQATLAPTAVSNSGNQVTNPQPTPTRANPVPTATPDTAVNDAPLAAAVALAQGEETPLPIAAAALQTGYPGTDNAGSASDNPTPYPPEQATPTAAPTQTRVAVIGSAPGYDGAVGTDAQTQPAAAGNGRGTLFLWLGFIVALLIFITGVIGSIVLYTRKSG